MDQCLQTETGLSSGLSSESGSSRSSVSAGSSVAATVYFACSIFLFGGILKQINKTAQAEMRQRAKGPAKCASASDEPSSPKLFDQYMLYKTRKYHTNQKSE